MEIVARASPKCGEINVEKRREAGKWHAPAAPSTASVAWLDCVTQFQFALTAWIIANNPEAKCDFSGASSSQPLPCILFPRLLLDVNDLLLNLPHGWDSHRTLASRCYWYGNDRVKPKRKKVKSTNIFTARPKSEYSFSVFSFDQMNEALKSMLWIRTKVSNTNTITITYLNYSKSWYTNQIFITFFCVSFPFRSASPLPFVPFATRSPLVLFHDT